LVKTTGERGVNLSGGQRQRLALARALYRSADVYLLDDPLSAVDAHVGRQIMDFIIEWLGEKTVIMPCHQLHFLHHADLIITLEDCTIAEQGTFAELMAAGGKFTELMTTQGASGDGEDSPKQPESSLGMTMTPRPENRGAQQQTDLDVLAALKGAGKGVSGGLIEDEERKTGKIKKEVYAFYLSQFSVGEIAPLIAFFALSQLSTFAMDVFLSRWAVGDTSLLLVDAPDPTMVYCGT
jgi:ABC-type multidrug transport system ATPase subunit